MKRALLAFAAGVLLATWPGAEASAQPWSAGLAGQDVASLAIHFGGLAPRTTLPDGAAFSGGPGAGISGTYWPSRYLGFRGNGFVASTSGNRADRTKAGQEDPTIHLFGGETLLRYPMNSGGLSWFPYIGLGGGAKNYDWSEDLTGWDSDLVFAWNAVGGLDIRRTTSPWYGMLVEVRRYSSKYKWHGHTLTEPVVNDLFLTIGLTLNR